MWGGGLHCAATELLAVENLELPEADMIPLIPQRYVFCLTAHLQCVWSFIHYFIFTQQQLYIRSFGKGEGITEAMGQSGWSGRWRVSDTAQ